MSSAVIQELRIERLDGLTPFRLGDLSPGINIIYGSNGIGKSRTADAMMHVLWPSRTREHDDRVHLLARLLIGEQHWTVEIDGDRVSRKRGSEDSTDSPPLPAHALCSRYRLSLHELLAAEDSDLASAILKESIGGYDLPSAFSELGIEQPTRRAPKELGVLREAAQSVTLATAEQSKHAAREARLSVLRRERFTALEARERASLVCAAINRQQLRAAHQADIERLAGFHPVLSRLRGDEVQQLEQLRGTLQQIENDIERQRHIQAQSTAELHLIDVRIQDARPRLVGTLRQLLQSLREMERHVQDLKQRCEEHTRQTAIERDWLHANDTDERLMAINTPDLNAVIKWANASTQLNVSQLAIEQAKILMMPSSTSGASLEVITEGMRLTCEWLSQPDKNVASGHTRQLVLLAICAITILAIVLAVLIGWPWIFSCLIALTLVPLLKTGTQADSRPDIQRRFAALGLASPVRWVRNDVEAVQFALSGQRVAADLEVARSSRRAELERQQASLAPQVAEAQSTGLSLTGQLGVDLATDPSLVMIFVTHLLQWRQAYSRLLGARAGLASATVDYQRLWSEAASLLSSVGKSSANVQELSATIDELDALIAQCGMASERALGATRELENVLEPRRRRQVGQIAAFFTQLGIEPEEEPNLEIWLEALPGYKAASQQHAISAENLRVSEATGDGKVVDLPEDDLRVLLDALNVEAQKISEIDTEIATIVGVAQAFTTGSTLQEALARRADAADALRRHRDAKCEMGVAYLLAERLRAQMRDRNRPPVFRRAQHLFERLTLGRFRLDFNDAEPPAFTAQNTATEERLKLSQLSSGTRLQLLICVRLAFVKEQEQGIAAPLFLDETLGNTDDERAASVIHSVIEIAREGRQIFYFTAQPDEAAKWRDSLVSGGVPHRLIDLGAVRNLDAVDRTPLQQIASATKPRVASSAGVSRLEYGRLLQVPGLRPDLDHIGEIHLWHLLDDMALLESLLTHGVRSWGAWQTLHRHGPQWIDPFAFARATARAKLIANLSSDWRVGRGRPIDRYALQQTGNVSDTFLDSVAALASELDGNPVELIAQLYERAIKGFGKSRVESLEIALEQIGYIDRRPRLSPEHLRLRALAALGGELKNGTLADDDIDRYLVVFTEQESAPVGSESA